MIVYFADRYLNIIGQASTTLPKGLKIIDDIKTEDVDTGVATFEFTLPYGDKKSERAFANKCTAVGNYILRRSGTSDKVDEFYTIIESEEDTTSHEINIYAEDAGLDLLNEVCEKYEATEAHPISFYIDKFDYDSGFVIGENQAADLSRKLKWDGESTATERLASVATQFDCEISYSFVIKGLRIVKKYINIYRKRGKDVGAQVRLNKDVDGIVTTKSIANLATALKVTGGIPEGEENPITLNGYEYDDGDIYLEGTYLKSRSAVAKWTRYLVEDGDYTGHILKTFTYDTTDQSTLCSHAVSELKKIREIEVNYEVDITKLPENARLGDRINIIDHDGDLLLSARILKLEVSEANGTQKATLGEYLIKSGGIHQKVYELAEDFRKNSQSAAHALTVANTAKQTAEEAQTKANAASSSADGALEAAAAAKTAADTAKESADEATTKAEAASDAVNQVKQDVESLETTVDNASAAAAEAKTAATTAETKAAEAKTAAEEAKTQAIAAEEAAGNAQTAADKAKSDAATAQTTATEAKDDAAAAKTTAEAAKADAAAAQGEIDSLGDDLETLSNTMTADYAKKTELTEAKADLQTQITQNAAQIQSTATKVTEIDETANNAAQQASQAQTKAEAAQTAADQAATDAATAQTAADNAKTAADNAQTAADTAKAAAATAQGVADKAETDLANAKKDLETVQGRVDATEEDIEAAQAAVNAAQAAADKAKADAAAAATKATTAQNTADTAASDAAAAQEAANDAASKATLAQQTADEAKGDATAAKTAADAAKATADEAQRTADAATTKATTAQTKADEAAADAAAAQTAADAASAKAQQAASDLETAKTNLANVTSRVDATEEEIEAAQAAVNAAQAAADQAAADAAAAQTTADTAKTNAETAQTAADNAKTAADNAQKAADAAKKAADAAQAAVDDLAVRVTKAETKITQTAEQIELCATKEEVTETLGGYYTKTEADAAITLKANEISQEVSTVKTEVNGLKTRTTNAETSIQQNASDILLRAKQSDLEALSGDLQENYYTKTETESSIDVAVDAITLTVTTALGDVQIKLAEDKIDLTGLVSFNDLKNTGSTIINGSNITTGTVAADRLNVKGLTVYKTDNSGNYLDKNGNITTSASSRVKTLEIDKNGNFWTCGTIEGSEIRGSWFVVNDGTDNYSNYLTLDANGLTNINYAGTVNGYACNDYVYIKDGGLKCCYGDSTQIERTCIFTSNGFSAYGSEGDNTPLRGSVYVNENGDFAIIANGNKLKMTSTAGVEITGQTTFNSSICTDVIYDKAGNMAIYDKNANASQISIGYGTLSAGYNTAIYGTSVIFSTPTVKLSESNAHIFNARGRNMIGDYATDGEVTIGNQDDYFHLVGSSTGMSYMTFNSLMVRPKNNTVDSLIFGCVDTNLGSTFRPQTDNKGTIGASNWRFRWMYCVNGVTTTSDRRQKKDISDDISVYKDILSEITPVKYRYSDIEGDKIRIGFIAQELDEAFEKHGLSPRDFAAITLDDIEPTDAIPDGKVYGLSYGGFVALNTALIQDLQKEVNRLKSEVQELKGA